MFYGFDLDYKYEFRSFILMGKIYSLSWICEKQSLSLDKTKNEMTTFNWFWFGVPSTLHSLLECVSEILWFWYKYPKSICCHRIQCYLNQSVVISDFCRSIFIINMVHTLYILNYDIYGRMRFVSMHFICFL